MSILFRQLATVAATFTATACIGWSATTASAHDHGERLPLVGVPFEREMDVSMGRMMEAMHAGGYSGNADVDFLRMMIPHHAGAVDMAHLVLQHGRDPVTRQIAEDIIAGQTVEIESMKRRLQMLRAPSAGAEPEFPALGGLRGP